jgi:octopine/nopaline transport system substrate-binding protein
MALGGSPGFRALAAAILGACLAVSVPGPVAADDLAIAVGTSDGSAVDAAVGGFERDLAQALCVKMQASCSIREVDREQALPALAAGEADIAFAALLHTPALEASAALSAPYAMPRHGFAVARAGGLSELPGTGKIASFTVTPKIAEAAVDELRAAFDGRSVGAKVGSADMAFLTEHFGDRASIRPYPTIDAALGALVAGEIVAVMAPVTDLAAAGQRPGFQAVRRSGPEFGEDELLGSGFAAAFRASDNALRNRFDRAIDRMIADGSLRKLSVRWFALDVTPQRCGCKPF